MAIDHIANVRRSAPTFVSALLSVFLVVAPPAAHAQTTRISTGVYSEGLLMGFEPTTQIVSGYYKSERGDGRPVFSCIFYLKGKLKGPSSVISTYFPGEPTADLIKGKLVVETSQKLQVRLQSEHGGCVTNFADEEEPAEFTLESAHAWMSVAVVKSSRAYFFDSPARGTRRKTYVVQDDGVGVRTSRLGWLEVDYIAPDGKIVSGWIRQADVYRVK